MKNATFSRSFFALMGMIVIGVAALLLLTAPARSSQTGSQGEIMAAMDSGHAFVEPANAPPVIEARLLSDSESEKMVTEQPPVAAADVATEAAASASATAD